MSQVCAAKKCDRSARGVCDCCQQNLCSQHLNEHRASLVAQLDPLADVVASLSNQLKALNVTEIKRSTYQNLEKWREDCYKKIDYIFQRKCQELDEIVHSQIDYQQKRLDQANVRIHEVATARKVTHQDIDTLSTEIERLQKSMHKLEQTGFTVNTRSLHIDDSSIVIKKITDEELDLATISPVYKKLTRSKESARPFTGNDEYLLIHKSPSICLFDRRMNMIKQTPWPYGSIQDMCWSSALKLFIILAGNRIFTLHDGTMSVDAINTIPERKWFSCTCSNTSLYLATNDRGTPIIEARLLPTMVIVREWNSPQTCSTEEIIVGIVYHNELFAIMLMNRSSKVARMELRKAKNMDRLWSFQLETKFRQNIAVRCCSLPFNEWLITDYESGHLLQITKDGKLKNSIKYHPVPYRAILFDQNKLVVLNATGVNMHTLQ